MKSRGPYRRHSTPFKLQLCQDIRNGVIGLRDAQRTYGVSANLIQLWLTQSVRRQQRETLHRHRPATCSAHAPLNTRDNFAQECARCAIWKTKIADATHMVSGVNSLLGRGQALLL